MSEQQQRSKAQELILLKNDILKQFDKVRSELKGVCCDYYTRDVRNVGYVRDALDKMEALVKQALFGEATAMSKIITVTTRNDVQVSGEFDHISYHPDKSREGAWLCLRNCTSDGDANLGYKQSQQGFALCDVKEVVTVRRAEDEKR